MNITLVTVGKIKEKYLLDAIAEYKKRLGRYAKMDIIEVKDEKTDENASEAENLQVKEREGERILAKIPDSGYMILLSLKGESFDSEGLAKRLQNAMNKGASDLYFVIGGSLGTSDAVDRRADEKWCFSKLTFPHQLMRVIVLEQIYRGFRILNHEPYHK